MVATRKQYNIGGKNEASMQQSTISCIIKEMEIKSKTYRYTI